MADNDIEDFEENEEEPKSSSMMTMVAMAVAALIGSFGVSYFMGGSEPVQVAECLPEKTEEVKIEAETVKAGLAKEDQIYVELDEILITIGSEPASRYLKLTLAIATFEGKESTIKKAQPILADAFNGYLRSIELNQLEDPAFYPYLREQLSRRAELVLGAAVADGVLITDFLLR